MDLKQIAGALVSGLDKHAPTILALAAVGGVVATTIVTAKKAHKIKEIVERKKQEMEEVAPEDKETKMVVIKETIKEAAPEVAPIVILGGLTIAAILASNQMHLGREASLTAAYIAADKALVEWKQAAKDTLDKKDYDKVQEKVVEKRVDEALDSPTPPIKTGYGNYLCVDGPTGQAFYSNIDRINKIVGDYNSQLSGGYDDFIPWNNFRRDLGLPTSSIGYTNGFNIKSGIQVEFSTHFDEDANAPVLYLEYQIEPRYKYGDL